MSPSMPQGTFLTFIQTVALSPFEDIEYKKIKQGLEVYKKGLKLGVITSQKFYLFADKENLDYYTHARSERYSFTKKSGQKVEQDFWEVPAAIIARPKDFGQWVSDSYQAAIRKARKLGV